MLTMLIEKSREWLNNHPRADPLAPWASSVAVLTDTSPNVSGSTLLENRDENIRLSPRAVGEILRQELGLFARRRPLGYELALDLNTQRRVHRLAAARNVLQPVADCPCCQDVLERLPEAEQNQARSLIRAAWKLDAKSGMARLEQLAQWLEREHPDAAQSLREGMAECFTINRLDVPLSLRRCLATTNLIESPQAGVRMKTKRVCRWRDQAMVKRWAGLLSWRRRPASAASWGIETCGL